MCSRDTVLLFQREAFLSPEEPGAVKYSIGGTRCLAPGIQDHWGDAQNTYYTHTVASMHTIHIHELRSLRLTDT